MNLAIEELHVHADDGRLDAVVELPVSNPTSCAFGGPALDRLYVTSAKLEREPLAGAIFEIAAGVRGAPAHRFAG